VKGCCNTHTPPFVLFDHLRFKAFFKSCSGSLQCVNSRGQQLPPMLILRKVSPGATFSTAGWGRASCTLFFLFLHVGCGWPRGLLRSRPQTHQDDRAKMLRSAFGAAELSERNLHALGKIITGLSALVGRVLHPYYCWCWSGRCWYAIFFAVFGVETCGHKQRRMCTKLARFQSMLSLEESRAVICRRPCFALFTQVLLRKHHRYELCFFLSCAVK